ncbi:MAG: hypothetical protein A2Y25_01025 [Candidatus Melainabacteria bacterium GWF2_37_15]|nr:MAG: hypothetical protein A2Y25_01025 [Candidatus Melainabacteria bacterium GWF2_37_15]
MAFFDYEALKDGKERIRGKLEATSEKEARELLRRQDLLPLRLYEVGSVKTIDNIRLGNLKKKTIKRKKVNKLGMRDKIDFTNIMYTFSKSGISLVESLYFIETNSESQNIQNLVVEIRRMIMAGTSLSDALARFPTIFDEVYIGLVRAGEESGELEETLKRISYLLEKQDRLNARIISTLAYPVFVMCLAFLVTTALLTVVFPAFKGMYDSMGADLPILTQIFMTTGLFLKQNWFLIPFIFISLLALLYFLVTWDVTKRFLDLVGLRIPVLEKFLRYTAIANFIIVMKVAFEAGITMVDSIMLANFTVKNAAIREALRQVIIDVQYGKSLSSALKTSNVMPGIVMCMVATGEESGSLSEMLDQAHEYIDSQIDQVVDLLSKLFEPFLFVIIGGIVLTLGLSLYLPLFQAYANLG